MIIVLAKADKAATALVGRLAKERFVVIRPESWGAAELQIKRWRPNHLLICSADLWDGKTAADVVALAGERWSTMLAVLYPSNLNHLKAEFPVQVRKGEVDELIQAVRRLAAKK